MPIILGASEKKIYLDDVNFVYKTPAKKICKPTPAFGKTLKIQKKLSQVT